MHLKPWITFKDLEHFNVLPTIMNKNLQGLKLSKKLALRTKYLP